MKKYIPYLVIFLIGALAGMWACRSYHVNREDDIAQRDTLVVYRTVKYSGLELARKTYKIDLPKTGISDYVFIPADSATIIYRDSVRYVTLPRQHFFTETADAHIWHSGIDSRIDSLNIFHRTETVTQTIYSKARRHTLSFGVEANYSTSLCFPVQLEYAYGIRPWFEVYGYLEYEPLRRLYGVGVGTKLFLEW